jgi:hypothetical protein
MPKEPKLYGFPYDEMGFLVEIRSLPSDRLYPVYTTLQQEELQYSLRSNKFGMNLLPTPFLYSEEEWIKNIGKKYKDAWNSVVDAKNIYGNKQTHHLGVFEDESGCYKLTSGIHVHFSSRDSNSGEVIDLPIEKIVRRMDESFKKEIEESGRFKGEYELKSHGFEYRSLPCNTDIYKTLKESFRILRSV